MYVQYNDYDRRKHIEFKLIETEEGEAYCFFVSHLYTLSHRRYQKEFYVKAAMNLAVSCAENSKKTKISFFSCKHTSDELLKLYRRKDNKNKLQENIKIYDCITCFQHLFDMLDDIKQNEQFAKNLVIIHGFEDLQYDSFDDLRTVDYEKIFHYLANHCKNNEYSLIVCNPLRYNADLQINKLYGISSDVIHCFQCFSTNKMIIRYESAFAQGASAL